MREKSDELQEKSGRRCCRLSKILVVLTKIGICAHISH